MTVFISAGQRMVAIAAQGGVSALMQAQQRKDEGR
jgi:hypothetical protein